MSRPVFGWASKTLLAVALFGALLWAMVGAMKAQAEVYVGLGHTAIHSKLTAPEFGYAAGPYRFSVGATGDGMTKHGYQEALLIVSAYRVVDPRWCYGAFCLKSAIGVAYTPNQTLVGPYNYRLEIILGLPADAELYITHYSSAGTFDNNTGIDLAGFRLRF